jgi:DNA-binding protein HU-beta
MAKSVTKADLITDMANGGGITKSQADLALQALTKAVKSALSKGNKVTLVGFGTFLVAKRAARSGVNPQTKKRITIPASRAVKFKAGKAMKDAVNK